MNKCILQIAFAFIFIFNGLVVKSQVLDLKIMSFNIQQPFGTNWEGRRDKAATIINNTQADVIGTQEAVNYQRDYLIQQTGYAWFGTGRDGGDSGEGSWIFYKGDKYTLDASNSGSFWMSDTPNTPSRFGGSYNRICTYVRLVENSSGQGFYVFNAHFPTPDLFNDRFKSMRLLAERVSSRAIQTDPVYLTGDFNSTEGDAVTVWMKSGSDNPLQCRDTYRDVDPNGSVNTGFGTKFDYIYCPNSPSYTTINSWVVNDPANASDHKPIVAEVRYSSTVVEPDPQPVPGKVEAEDYVSMLGVQQENTQDIGGGKNVGFLGTGDWMKYSISVAKEAIYKLEIRSAAESATGKFDVFIDNVFNKTITLNSTGGWQQWVTTTNSIELAAGVHELKIEIKDGDFNLNWLNFSEMTTSNESFQVKIVSANLWRKNDSWTSRRANVVNLINGELPDVVGIQEGDEGKQAELDADLTNYKIETGPWNDQSTAILYHSGKVKVVETGVFGFSSQPDNPSVSDWGDGAANGWLRVCNWVLFEQLATSSRFYVYNTHLDANGFTPNAGEWRSKEVRLMAERIASRSNTAYPFVLVGDLNGVEQEEAIQYLKSGTENPVKMVDTYREQLPNGPGDSFGSVKYDYIMIENSPNNQTVDANIIYHSQYGFTSDHNQVFATINFLKDGVSAPQITLVTHEPKKPTSNEQILVSANVTDQGGIKAVTLKWGTESATLSTTEVMTGSGNEFSATITGQPNKTTVYYQIVAENNDGIITSSQVYSVFISDEQFGLYADYDVTDLMFTGFGGSSFAEIDNPFPTDGNNSGRVASTVQGLETWAGIFSEIVPSIDFTATPILKMNVYAPKTGDMLIKFEDELDDEVFFSKTISITEVDKWIEIAVDFSDAPSGVYEKLVLFFDYNIGLEDTYYFDNLRLEGIVTSVAEQQLGSTITMSPNPASDRVQFSEPCNWVIYSISGKVMLTGNSSSAELSDLHSGVYLVKVGDYVQRLIKR